MNIPNVMEILQKGLQLEDLEVEVNKKAKKEEKKMGGEKKIVEKKILVDEKKMGGKNEEKKIGGEKKVTVEKINSEKKIVEKIGGQKTPEKKKVPATIEFVGEEQTLDNTHKKKIKCISLNPKINNLLASMSLDGFIKLWDLKFVG